MQFFSFGYWFGFPGFISPRLLWLLVISFGILFIGGLIAQIWYSRIQDRYTRQVVRRAGVGAAWIGALGLALAFMRSERIPVFMYRYWLLILGVAAAMWIFRMTRYAESRRDALDAETHKYKTKDRFLKK